MKFEYARFKIVNEFGEFNYETHTYWQISIDWLNKLGEQGWELINYNCSNGLFKRIKENVIE